MPTLPDTTAGRVRMWLGEVVDQTFIHRQCSHEDKRQPMQFPV